MGEGNGHGREGKISRFISPAKAQKDHEELRDFVDPKGHQVKTWDKCRRCLSRMKTMGVVVQK